MGEKKKNSCEGEGKESQSHAPAKKRKKKSCTSSERKKEKERLPSLKRSHIPGTGNTRHRHLFYSMNEIHGGAG